MIRCYLFSTSDEGFLLMFVPDPIRIYQENKLSTKDEITSLL